jgi:hypothetical protein
MKSLIALAAVLMLTGAAELPKALVDPYLEIQAGLADDKIDGLAPRAKAIETAATALGKQAEGVVKGAKKLGEAKDIAAARDAFGNMSAALVEYAEKTKTDLGDVKVAYCPMADKPWLQKEKDIRNPYYGASMLTCGSFKK